MIRPLFGCVVPMLAATMLLAGPAAAAPVMTVAKGSAATLSATSVQNVHWVWHHHHRIWISDHHHFHH